MMGQVPVAVVLEMPGKPTCSTVHHETLALITSGEGTGELEAALERALDRRQFTALSIATAGTKAVSAIAYGLAVLTVLATVLSFYSSYFGALRNLR